MEDKGFRRTAVAIGLLFWLSNLVTLVGGALTGFIPTSANALTGMYPHATQLVVGTLVAHVNDVAIIGYTVLLYPVLARHGQGLALVHTIANIDIDMPDITRDFAVDIHVLKGLEDAATES